MVGRGWGIGGVGGGGWEVGEGLESVEQWSEEGDVGGRRRQRVSRRSYSLLNSASGISGDSSSIPTE